MREFETAQTEYKLLTKMTCDLCGESCGPEGWHYEDGEYCVTMFGMKEGEMVGDHWRCIDTYFDVCPTCFRSKVMAWMADNGARPQVEDG